MDIVVDSSDVHWIIIGGTHDRFTDDLETVHRVLVAPGLVRPWYAFVPFVDYTAEDSLLSISVLELSRGNGLAYCAVDMVRAVHDVHALVFVPRPALRMR